MKTQAEIRRAFWESMFPDGMPHKYHGKRQNDLPCDIRCAFCDYVDSLAADGIISEALAERVTL